MTDRNPAEVLIVHAVDTEGPLYESLEAKFERLEDLYGITDLPVTWDTFRKLQDKEIDLGGVEEHVAQTLNGHLTNYNDTWDKIDKMLERVTDYGFRTSLKDSYGGGWVFNWHCLDHVGFLNNPRRRDMGYHNVFDHYRSFLERIDENRDEIHWHFHPVSTYRDAHRCATSFVNSPELYQILCRRVIERNWFPTVFRAGFQAERPDSNLFLEQWIPFDISNMALDDNTELDNTIDFRNGRSGDWRLAPADWSVYHPDHDYYQRPGRCRRWIGRALNVLNRIASIDEKEMDKAFARAAGGRPALVGIASHDFRDLGTEVEFLMDLIRKTSSKHPDVKYRYCGGIEGFRRAIWPDGINEDPLELEVEYYPATEDDVASIEVSCKRGQVFGPQPFLAIETRSRRFIHDNLDFATTLDRWYYAFHGDTLPIEDVKHIGVAANDQYGNVSVRRLEVEPSGSSANAF